MTVAEKSEARTEQSQETTNVNDVTYVHDSIVIREVVHDGDSVVEVTRWRDRWRERIVHDTIIERVTDTVRLTETVEKTTEVPARGAAAGWWVSAAFFAVIVIYILIKSFFKTN